MKTSPITKQLTDDIYIVARGDKGEAAAVFHYKERLDVLSVVLKNHIGNGFSNEATSYDVQVLLARVRVQKSVEVVVI